MIVCSFIRELIYMSNAPINVNPVRGECGQGAGIWCLRLSPCRAFDRAKRPQSSITENNSSFCTLPSCLAYISLIFSYPWIEFGNTQRQNIFVHEFMNTFFPFLKSLYNLFVSCRLQYFMNLISFCLQKFKLSCLQYQVMRTWNYCI